VAGSRRIDGWKLPPEARSNLLARFPPNYPNLVADHVTFKPGSDGGAIPDVDHCVLVGRADDGVGVEALVVAIAGTTERPDGSSWHITWSLADGRAAKESNAVIAEYGWEPIDEEIRVPLERGWWPWP